jgi:cell division protein FtsI (penicillin-binding protein 3)
MAANRNSVIRRRALVVLGGLAMGASLLVARLVYLQVFQAGHLSALAEAQRTKTVDLSAVRGEIVDANGKELAVSVDAYSVYAMPREAKDFDPKATADKLAPVLGMKPADLEKQLQGQHFRWLKRKEPKVVRDQIRALKLAGVGLVRESRRVYPKGQLAATLIGFVGVDNQGLAGIEHAFDKVLRGPSQKMQVQVDAYGREILREGANDPVATMLSDGNRVVLTIDENLQHIAERELARSVKEADALRGAVMMMETATGNLKAFAINPTYDPNQFGKYDWNQLKNWAVTDVYEPGSTMKIFTVAGALERNRITTNQTFYCPPYIKVDGRIVSDHDFPKGRDLTPFGILEESSNVGTTKIAFTMSTKEHRELIEKMGFGRLTGAGITGEAAGVLHKLPWRAITQATISYGQGISVTPLQILSAASAIGNGGIRMTPRLIDKVVTAKGEVLQEFPPKSQGQVLKPETAKEVMKMLETVVETGTGVEAQVPGYRLAGKTGTAQKIRDDGRGYSSDVIASFLGFFPSDKPRYVMLTLLDRPRKTHWASLTAAPLFGRVAGETLRHMAVTPTEPLTKPKPKPKTTHETL